MLEEDEDADYEEQNDANEGEEEGEIDDERICTQTFRTPIFLKVGRPFQIQRQVKRTTGTKQRMRPPGTIQTKQQ